MKKLILLSVLVSSGCSIGKLDYNYRAGNTQRAYIAEQPLFVQPATATELANMNRAVMFPTSTITFRQ